MPAPRQQPRQATASHASAASHAPAPPAAGVYETLQELEDDESFERRRVLEEDERERRQNMLFEMNNPEPTTPSRGSQDSGAGVARQ
eukprot:gene5663-biopygen2764